MSYDTEQSRHPQPAAPGPAAPRTPQTPRTEPAQAPREPGTGTGTGPGTTSPDREPGPDLIAQDQRDKFTLRLQQALSTFVESPRQAVEEADAVFDDVAVQFTATLTERHRVLRTGWQDQDSDTRTEELRIALRQYREMTERLLRMAAPAGR